MACRRMATCRARFARGEQACVRCAEGKLDVGDVEDLDDEEDSLDEGEADDDDVGDDNDADDDGSDADAGDDDNDDEDDDDNEVGYTTQPDGTLGEIADTIVVNGHRVPGIRVTVTFEDGEDEEYVIVVEDEPGDLPGNVLCDMNSVVDLYAQSHESLYGVLERFTGFVIKQK